MWPWGTASYIDECSIVANDTKSDAERLGRRRHHGGVVPVDAGDVDVELDLVAVGVAQIQAVREAVVARPDDLGPMLAERCQRVAKVVVGVADLEAEVVHPDPAS